jgi:glycosyltransferase involved in cell wall biosynthesis
MKISIIVPVYLSECFLNKNFENLVNQSYNNLEIIYVNDGSPDSSGAICDKFASIDDRVKVIHQTNKGAAEALNTGVNFATGDFMMFLDADDWIELNTCELAVTAASMEEVDMVFWPNIKEYGNKSVVVPSYFKESREFRGKNIVYLRRRMIGLLKEELINPIQTDAFNAGWGKLYRSKVIKNNTIKWTDTKRVGSSDVLFNAHLMPFINSAYYLNIYLHHYNRNNPNSLTKTYNDTLQEKFSTLFNELKAVVEEKYSKSEDYNLFLKALNNRITLSIINIGLGYVKNGMSTEGFKKFKILLLSNRYQKSLKEFQTNYLPIHYRVFFLCCKHRLFLAAYFLLYIMQRLR